jgi:hypothetical protein
MREREATSRKGCFLPTLAVNRFVNGRFLVLSVVSFATALTSFMIVPRTLAFIAALSGTVPRL